MPSAGVWVEISEGNIVHDHIYLRGVLEYFPADSVGGTNKATASPRTISIEFSPGSRIESDIDGNHLFLRNRSGVREFFELTKAERGDVVLISKTGDRSFKFELIKR